MPIQRRLLFFLLLLLAGAASYWFFGPSRVNSWRMRNSPPAAFGISNCLRMQLPIRLIFSLSPPYTTRELESIGYPKK